MQKPEKSEMRKVHNSIIVIAIAIIVLGLCGVCAATIAIIIYLLPSNNMIDPLVLLAGHLASA